MNGAHRVPPYFAVARSIEKHPLFNVQRKRRRSWREAWEWMIAEAAWRPRGQRMARGVADLQRGQIAVTARGLAAAWNWSIGNVQYFLKRLREEGMIETRAIHTKIHTGSEFRRSYRATLVTLCNYDRFQSPPKSGLSQSIQGAIQELQSDLPQLPGMKHKSAPQPHNHFTIDKSISEKGGHHYKPHHSATSKDGRWVWCDCGTEEWDTYNHDYREARGADIMPEDRIGGQGNWFFRLGEAMRPERRRRR